MHEFRSMSVLHADLVDLLPKGKNSKEQHRYQYILSAVELATRYPWLLPLCHKTADSVATTLFDDVISRVLVPSTVLMHADQTETSFILEKLGTIDGVASLPIVASEHMPRRSSYVSAGCVKMPLRSITIGRDSPTTPRSTVGVGTNPVVTSTSRSPTVTLRRHWPRSGPIRRRSDDAAIRR